MASAKPAVSKKSEGPKKKMAGARKVAEIVLPPGYKPSENEPFMNDMHKAYFRKRLLEWKDEILRQTRETLAILHEDSTRHADLADRATSETDRATELRTRDRQRKLIAKIDAALGRIEDGSYGYCEDTGEPIGLKRLDARPIATLSVEAQERQANAVSASTARNNLLSCHRAMPIVAPCDAHSRVVKFLPPCFSSAPFWCRREG